MEQHDWLGGHRRHRRNYPLFPQKTGKSSAIFGRSVSNFRRGPRVTPTNRGGVGTCVLWMLGGAGHAKTHRAFADGVAGFACPAPSIARFHLGLKNPFPRAFGNAPEPRSWQNGSQTGDMGPPTNPTKGDGNGPHFISVLHAKVCATLLQISLNSTLFVRDLP